MNKISVIIPTYKAPEYLDLCIKSILKGRNNDCEIVVVVDGTYDINREVIKKYKDNIELLSFSENMGLSSATNHGIYKSSNDIILIVNDDNVFPKNWDSILLEDFKENYVLTPNQIEPYPSMFKQFIQYDFGKTYKEFNLDEYINKELNFRSNKITDEGSTLPFMVCKKNYLKIGGWDESYPSGNVVDWDFFLKCNLNGYEMKRTYKCNFYHFVSTTYKSPEQIQNSKIKEQESFEYFKYKWGKYPLHNSLTNLKTI